MVDQIDSTAFSWQHALWISRTDQQRISSEALESSTWVSENLPDEHSNGQLQGSHEDVSYVIRSVLWTKRHSFETSQNTSSWYIGCVLLPNPHLTSRA